MALIELQKIVKTYDLGGTHKCSQSPAFVKLENNNVVFAGTVALK